jgi:hypothetical protein
MYYLRIWGHTCISFTEVHFVGLYCMIILQCTVQYFILEEPIAQLPIVAVKSKTKYKFLRDSVIVFTEKLRNFVYFFKVSMMKVKESASKMISVQIDSSIHYSTVPFLVRCFQKFVMLLNLILLY